MYNFDSCGESRKDPIIPCTDKKSKVKFTGLNKNRKTILKVRVDGCLEIQGQRCDWLLIDIEAHIAHFIELKGRKLEHALLQLKNTILIISNPQNKYTGKEFKKSFAYAILSHCPINSTQIQIHRKKFRRECGANLTVKCGHLHQQL